MRRTVLLTIFSLIAFASLTGFMISGNYPTAAHQTSWQYFSAYVYGGDWEGVDDASTVLEKTPSASNIIIEWKSITGGHAVITLPTIGTGAPNISAECVAIKYSYKGAAHIFKAQSSQDDNYNSFQTSINAVTDFTEITLTPGTNLVRPQYGTQTAWAASSITELDWDAPADADGSLEIKDVECVTDGDNSSSSGNESPATTPGDGNSYYVFKYNEASAPSPWGDYIMAYTYNGATVGNPAEGDDIVTRIDGVAKIYDVTAGDGYWGAFIGAATKNKVTGQSPGPIDCINGFSYWYKSNQAHTFIAQFPIGHCTVTGNNVYGNQWKKAGIPIGSNWTKIKIALSDLGDSDKTGCGDIDKDLSIIEQIVWGFEGNPNVGGGGNLMIANVVCLAGDDIENDSAPPESISFTNNSSTNSSSSSANNTTTSSSSNSTTTNSSSSVNAQNNSSSSSNTNDNNSSSSGGTGNSQGDYYCIYADLRMCSGGHAYNYNCPNIGSSVGVISSICPSGYDGNTPIILSHQAYSNALSVMQNAVNLQIMGNATVQVFDLKGNAVRTLSFAQGNYIVPLSGLPRGLYIIKANSASWSKTITVPIK